jgi:hypothetical protein
MKKKRFDTGGSTNVRTRSDDEIGDTNPRTGVYTPGSYAARQEQGQKNLDSVKGFFNKLTGKSADAAPAAPATYDENPAAKYIRKSVGQESTVSRPSESTISGSQVDKNKNYESEATPTPAPTPAPAPAARRLPITIEGDYPKKPDTTGTSVEEAPPPASPKKEVKKTKVVEKSKSETPVPTKRQDTQKMYPSGVMGGATLPSKKSTSTSVHPRTGRPMPFSDDPAQESTGLPNPVTDSKKYKEEINQRLKKQYGGDTPYTPRIKSGGAVKKMASGGMTSRSSASSRGDGIASRGKTRGKIC